MGKLFQTANVVFACVVLAAGCRGPGTYRAHNLPQELVAPPAQHVGEIDLSRLSTYAVSNELIDRGDVLDVTIVTNFGTATSTTTPVRVGEDGTGNVPLVGKVALAGLELEGAEQAIVAAAVHNGVFRGPHVTVTMRRQRVNRVTVVGAVEEQGVYMLPRGNSSLLAALVAAGGLSEDAACEVEIRRPVCHGGRPDPFAPGQPQMAQGNEARLTSYTEPPGAAPQTIRVNLVDAARQGDNSYFLDDGDVVMVPKQEPKMIHVMGLVRKPGQFELPPNQDLYLLDGLSLAGGTSIQLADSVLLLRRVPGQSEPARIKLSVRNAKHSEKGNLRLAAGDVISVEETPLTFVMMALGRIGVGVGGTVPLF